MTKIVIEGFSLGVSSGIYCLSSCIVFFLPYMFSEARQGIKNNFFLLLEFLFGRLCAYLIFALMISFLAQRYKEFIQPSFLSFALIFSSLLMIIYALVKNLPALKICQRIHSFWVFRRIPFILGFLLGINICPPFLLGLVKLIEIANIFLGVVFFLSFFLATCLYTLFLLFFAGFTHIQRLQNIARLVSLLVGLWFLFNGLLAFLK